MGELTPDSERHLFNRQKACGACTAANTGIAVGNILIVISNFVAIIKSNDLLMKYISLDTTPYQRACDRDKNHIVCTTVVATGETKFARASYGIKSSETKNV
jgi:hypothetical protein